METQDMEILASKLLQDFEGGAFERHEIHARLHQTLDQMRAFGMPPPDDLLALEKELADAFEAEAKES